MVGNGSLSGYDNLYLLDTIASFNESVHINIIGVKRKLTSENLALLWHNRLDHISKRRIERLVSDSILDPFYFLDFYVYVNCIK